MLFDAEDTIDRLLGACAPQDSVSKNFVSCSKASYL